MPSTNRLLELELYPHVGEQFSVTSNNAIQSAIERFKVYSGFFPHWYNCKFQLWRWARTDTLMWQDPGKLWGSFGNTWIIFIALPAMQWEGREIIFYWCSHAIPRQIDLSLIPGRVCAYHNISYILRLYNNNITLN